MSPVAIAASTDPHPDDVAATLHAALPVGLACLIVFFSSDRDPAALAEALGRKFEGTRVFGCTTAGELTPSGIQDGSVIAIGLPAADFTVVPCPLLALSALSIKDAQGVARRGLAEIRDTVEGWSQAATFGLLLVDGLSNREERLVSALDGGLEGVPVIGGSAGDGLDFERTRVIVDGAVHGDAAVLMLIHSRRPIHAFKCDHFDPTPVKLVVTRADVERRIVYELNAAPAAREYAAAVGLSDSSLSPMSFAAHPVVVRVGGDYYVRSIQKVNDDGSLSFFCAIDEGMVLTTAKARNPVSATKDMFSETRAEIGDVSLYLGFECVFRRLDAEQHQFAREMSNLYRENRVVGFHTYGEQYRSMHVNQTLTGVAIGKRPGPA